MKKNVPTIAASLVLGFSAWRLWERSSLTARFVQAGVSPQDASVATAQVLPFFSTSRASDVEDTVEQASAPGQANAEYFALAEDLWLIAKGKA